MTPVGRPVSALRIGDFSGRRDHFGMTRRSDCPEPPSARISLCVATDCHQEDDISMGLTMVYGREAGRRKVAAVLAGAAMLLGAAGLPKTGGSSHESGQLVNVIVQEVPGAAAQAVEAVKQVGGQVG